MNIFKRITRTLGFVLDKTDILINKGVGDLVEVVTNSTKMLKDITEDMVLEARLEATNETKRLCEEYHIDLDELDAIRETIRPTVPAPTTTTTAEADVEVETAQ